MATSKPNNKQINVRADDDMRRLLDELRVQASAVTGLQVSQSDVIRLALQALAREYEAREKKSKK